MSRSYKKTPYAGLKKCKFNKNYSNRRIRRLEQRQVKIADGRAYKKVHDSWDICDWRWIETWPQFQQRIRELFTKHQQGITPYTWKYYCRNHGLNPDKLDWVKLQSIWRRSYKSK